MEKLSLRKIGICPLSLALAVVSGTTITHNASAQLLEEIVVTAQKREESIQEVPIAISAFDAGALEAQQIRGFSDMRFSAPNVNVNKANFTRTNFSIRGVGTNLAAASAESGVGIHVNEVPLVRPRLFETEYYDVDQVSILRGPQGTLYGRNSTGGAVNMATRRAHTDGFESNIEAQYGNYEHKKVKGAVNLPINEQLAVRFAGIWLDRDGYTENTFTNNDVDGRDQYSMRGSLHWENDKTSVDLMLSYFEEDSTRSRSQKIMCNNDPSGLLGCLPDKLDYESPHPSANLSVLFSSDFFLGSYGLLSLGNNDYPFNPSDVRKVHSNYDPIYKADEKLATLSVKHQLDNHEIALVAGYQETSVLSNMDYTWSAPNPVEIPDLTALGLDPEYAALFQNGALSYSSSGGNSTGTVGGYISDRTSVGIDGYDESSNFTDQASVELRVRSDYDGPFNFLAGAFYMEVDTKNNYSVFATSYDYFAAVYPSIIGITTTGQGWVSPFFDSETDYLGIRSKALFGEVYWEFSDSLKLTVGARYTIDDKDVRDREVFFDRDTNGAIILQDFGEDAPILDPHRSDTTRYKQTTGRIVLDWKINNNTLAYASYSRGYKPGGFNPPFDAASFPNQEADFAPEFINAFEIGVKNTLLDDSLQANITAFAYDYKGMQISKIINRSSFNENTDAEIYGLEGEFIWAPNEKWLLNANVSYLHTEIQDLQSVDTRDPTNGQDDVTLIKDYLTAANCVLEGISPEDFAAFWGPGLTAHGPQYNSCATLESYESFGGYEVTGGVEADLDGNQLQNSPEWSVGLGVEYNFELPQDYQLSTRLDYYWQDAMYARSFNKPIDKIDDWDTVNIQIHLSSRSRPWYAKAFVKNVMDDDHLVGQYVAGPASGLFTNVFAIEPRTFGLAIGYNIE